LSIVDLTEGKVGHEIPDITDDVQVAASAEDFAIVQPGTRRAER
jgi:hypothetical protein